MRESASVRLTWSFGPGPATGGSGGRPPGLRPVFSAFSARASSFASYSAPFPLKAFARPRLDHRLGLGDAGQTILAPGQFLGHRHPVGHIRPIGRLRQRHQLRHLGLQPGFELAGVFPRQRAVPARVGVHLGAVQRHRAELQHPGFPGQQQHLDEQPFDPVEKTPPERGDGIVVGMIVGRDEAESDRIIGRALQLAARKHPRGVAVDQKPQQHARVIGRRARAAIGLHERREVQLLDHLDHEARQMPLGKPFLHRRRQQKPRLPVDRSEIAHDGLHHARANQLIPSNPISTPGSSPTGC